MPTDVQNFLPVLLENPDSVRARLDADANAGLDPGDPNFIDTTPGGWYWDTTQAPLLEIVRLYGYLAVEIVAAMNPGTAWGPYLDVAGESLDVFRNAAVQASGVVQFAGTVGVLIPAGTEVGTVVPDPSTGDVPVLFQTQASITLAVAPGPAALIATPSGSGGTIPAGAHYYVVTAVTPAGETIASNEVLATTSGGTSSVVLTWSSVAGATAYNIYRSSTIGVETFLHAVGAVLTYTDNGSLVPGATAAPTNTVAVLAEETGSAGNVAAGAISQVLSPISSVPSVTNPSATTGGADVESDARFQKRILAEVGKSDGAGNVSDYQRWVLAEFPQVGFVTVNPLWAGPGTVLVIITDVTNEPLSPTIVAAVQAFLDPIAGQGAGQAPIGATVTVQTPTVQTVSVVAVIAPSSGYTLDGTDGTVAIRTSINAAIETYVNGLAPNTNVILSKVIGQIVLVPGVADVSGVTLNGVAANLSITGNKVASTSDGLISLS